MRVIARTSRNTGGPLGLILLAIGGLLYLVAMAIVFVATAVAAGAMFVGGEARCRSRAAL